MTELLAALGWFGAGVAALFAAVLLARRSAAERGLGAGFAVAAIAAGLVTASHSGHASDWIETAEVTATLLAGPLAASWLAGVAGQRIPPPVRWAAFSLAIVWLALAALGTPWTLDRRAIRWAVVLQIAWTAAAALLAASRWRALGAAPRRLLAVGLAGCGVLHLAQIARLVAPASTPRDLVPATVGLLVGALSFAALRRTRLPLAVQRAGATEPGDGARLLADLDRWLRGERGFLDPGISVATAAKRIGATPAQLSRAINRELGHSFSDHLAQLRVAEAQRLLLDPALAHLAVEAIGTRAGFRSRSVFFAEFRRRTGQSPAAYRLREPLVGG
jgi:AraC-like DNA-binding protein